jgi:hypothetical protein
MTGLPDVLVHARDELDRSVAAVLCDPDRLVPLPFATMPGRSRCRRSSSSTGSCWDLYASRDGRDVATLNDSVVDAHLETAAFTLAATAAKTADEGIVSVSAETAGKWSS